METRSSSKEKENKEITEAIKLEVLSGPMDGSEFFLQKEITTIGREEKNDILMPFDTSISRHHSKISFENECYWLEDVGSRNGTYIGEDQINRKVKIDLETIFRLGKSEMRLVSSNQ